MAWRASSDLMEWIVGRGAAEIESGCAGACCLVGKPDLSGCHTR